MRVACKKTGSVLVKSWYIFTSPSSFPLFLLLSAFLFSFRSALHLASLSLSSSLDHHHPHLVFLLSRVSSPPTPTPQPPHQSDLFHRHSHFSPPPPPPSPPSNLSFLLPNNKPPSVFTVPLPPNNPNNPLLVSFNLTSSPIVTRRVGRDALLSIVQFFTLFSLAHLHSIFFFLLSYSVTLTSVFLISFSSLLRRPPPSLSSAVRLGLRRLPILLFLRWSLRDALSHLLLLLPLSLPLPSDHLSLLKLLLRLKLLPFSLTALPPPPSSPSSPSSSFPFLFSLLDLPFSALFSFNCWVNLLHRRARRRDLHLGFRLSPSSTFSVFLLKLLELVVCGDLGMRFALTLGPALAMAAQSIAEVYFMVAWLLLYLSARSEAEGRRFGRTQLQEFYNDRRDE